MRYDGPVPFAAAVADLSAFKPEIVSDGPSRVEVRVIHGRGTGAVRKAVRDELAKHPLVDEQVSDSADGATVVRLGGSPARA